MRMNVGRTGALVILACVGGFFAGHQTAVEGQGNNRVFEIRTYTTENKAGLDALVKRMREGEAKIFEKVGMTGIGYFVAADAPKSDNTYVYILAHQNQDAAKASWAKFREDPEWVKLRTSSTPTGPIKVESVFVNPLDFSGLK